MTMQSQTSQSQQPDIFYPDTDGLPMANNTIQFRWILVIQQNLDWLFADDSVFVAGDLFWYPIAGRSDVKTAPDVMVVFGRPKSDRGSYKQWEEENIPPQVVFEILSPGNTSEEMERKLLFYDRFGVEEYYIYDPDTHDLRIWLRGDLGLDVVPMTTEWISPRLQVRFDMSREELVLYRSDGERFLSYQEIAQRLQQQQQQLEQQQQQLEQEQQRLTQAVSRLLEMGLSSAQVAEALALAPETVQQIIDRFPNGQG